MTTDPTNTAANEDDVEFAIDLARAAGEFTQRFFGRADLTVEAKADGTPVTEADRGAEAVVVEAISQRFPDDAILGEEHGAQNGTTGRHWVIDPIDGTKAFARGVPLYSNLVSLLVDGVPVVGVINLPAVEQTVWAGTGLGAFVNGARCAVNTVSDPADAFVMTSGFGAWPVGATERLGAAGMKLRTWGDAYGYYLVATGQVEAMVDPIAELWDLAAPSVIVPEAGGCFTHADGSPFTCKPGEAPSAVASNGRVHDTVRRALWP